MRHNIFSRMSQPYDKGSQSLHFLFLFPNYTSLNDYGISLVLTSGEVYPRLKKLSWEGEKNEIHLNVWLGVIFTDKGTKIINKNRRKTMSKVESRSLKVQIFIGALFLFTLMGFGFDGSAWTFWAEPDQRQYLNPVGVQEGTNFQEIYWSKEPFHSNSGDLISRGPCYSVPLMTGNDNPNNLWPNSMYSMARGSFYFEPHRLADFAHNDSVTTASHLPSTEKQFCFLGNHFYRLNNNFEYPIFLTHSSIQTVSTLIRMIMFDGNYTGYFKFISWAFCNLNSITDYTVGSILWNAISKSSSPHMVGFSREYSGNHKFISWYCEQHWHTDTYFNSSDSTNINNNSSGTNPGTQSMYLSVEEFCNFKLQRIDGLVYNTTDPITVQLRPLPAILYSLDTHSYLPPMVASGVGRIECTDELKFLIGGENASNLKFIESPTAQMEQECFNEIAFI